MPETGSISPNNFHVGITMAGAVSAGCYTGGVMDYLFEILDLWETAKKEQLPDLIGHFHKIPKHKVIIDVMGGASAGGMTTSMASIYALNGKINPITDPEKVGGVRNNIFYDSWVLLEDDDRKTFDKVWDLDDLSAGKVTSLLNSTFVDNIANRAFATPGNLQTNVANLPPYISPNLEMLLSHCTLRGIPMEIDFKTPIAKNRPKMDAPSHNTFEHLTISYYKLNGGKPLTDTTSSLWLNPYEAPHADVMRLATKATGAFPLGLKFREFTATEFPGAYVKSVAEDIVFRSFGKTQPAKYNLNWSHFAEPFNFVTVDGGAVNNEPFGEVLSVLQSRYGTSEEQRKQYGLIMIDPFPDFIDRQDEYKAPDDLLSMIPALARTLQEQSKVKRAEMLGALSDEYYRGVIYPVKRKSEPEHYKKEKYPIACESVAAFGGFLDINFRHHDFFLGRDNARNFFRYFFSFEYTPANPHPIHAGWTPDMVEAFKVEVKGKIFLPIIPDINLLRERLAGEFKKHLTHTIPAKPVFNPASLFALRSKMEDRFQKILELTQAKLTKPKTKHEATLTDKLMEQYYPRGWWDKLKGWVVNKGTGWIFNLTKGGLARSITEAALKWMVKDLEEKGLLK